ncbi:MAG: molybdopterin-dependent oxidoreductase [Actinobacteria bacterium]|nr:molybdopterin-dependent oxidoreductase [Actinomycetota bacterium]
MRKRRILFIIGSIIAVLLLSFMIFAGCSGQGKDAIVTETDWSITIKDADGKSVEFTNKDAAGLALKEIKAELEKKDGTKIKETWKGVLLSEALKSKGFKQYKTVAIEASDGYRQEYEASTVNDGSTMLGFYLDGKELTVDDGLVELVAPALSGKFWIKNVTVIEILN